jgi:hypothetical protein
MEYQFVAYLPDLIQPEEYGSDPAGKRVRLRIRVREDGIEILGDSVRPKSLEALLGELDFVEVEQMLCG